MLLFCGSHPNFWSVRRSLSVRRSRFDRLLLSAWCSNFGWRSCSDWQSLFTLACLRLARQIVRVFWLVQQLIAVFLAIHHFYQQPFHDLVNSDLILGGSIYMLFRCVQRHHFFPKRLVRLRLRYQLPILRLNDSRIKRFLSTWSQITARLFTTFSKTEGDRVFCRVWSWYRCRQLTSVSVSDFIIQVVLGHHRKGVHECIVNSNVHLNWINSKQQSDKVQVRETFED
jgi:hypothetical protein